MKLKRNRLLIMTLVAGFLCGVIYVSKVEIEGTVFEKGLFRSFGLWEIDDKKYLLYIAKERLISILLILIFSSVRYKKMIAIVSGIILGIASGGSLSVAIYQNGIEGGLLWILGLIPHVIFYGLAYGILLSHWIKDGRWNVRKTCGIIIFTVLGILSEAYVNPNLIKLLLC